MDEEYAVEVFNKAAGKPKVSRFGRVILEGLRKRCEEHGMSLEEFLYGSPRSVTLSSRASVEEKGAHLCDQKREQKEHKANYLPTIMDVIFSLDHMDDNMFLLFYMELSREFEHRFGCVGWCERVKNAIKSGFYRSALGSVACVPENMGDRDDGGEESEPKNLII